jgi:hypothetical protein
MKYKVKLKFIIIYIFSYGTAETDILDWAGLSRVREFSFYVIVQPRKIRKVLIVRPN